MATILADQLLDLTKLTLSKFGRHRFNDIAASLQSYPVLSQMLRKDRVMEDGGKNIDRFILKDYDISGDIHAGLFEEDNVNVGAHMDQLNVPWVHAKENYGYEVREMLMNSGAERLLSLLKPRRHAMMMRLAEGLETGYWTLKGSTESKKPLGEPYWVVRNATEGFNGGLPSGFTDVGGIDPTTTTGWKNYTFTYSNLTADDGIRSLRKAHYLTKWVSPESFADYRKGRFQDFKLYTNVEGVLDLVDAATKQNDRVGADLATYDGKTLWFGHPIVHIPKLDADSTNPLIMCDLAWMHMVVLKGDYLRQTGPEHLSDKHNVIVTHVDLTYQFICTNRRQQGIGYKV